MRFISPPATGERIIVMPVSVREHISGNTRLIFSNFCPCYLWPWLGPALVVLRYVMYIRFMDDVILAHKSRQLNVATQLMEAHTTCSLGLGYKRRVGISVTGQCTHTNGLLRPQWER